MACRRISGLRASRASFRKTVRLSQAGDFVNGSRIHIAWYSGTKIPSPQVVEELFTNGRVISLLYPRQGFEELGNPLTQGRQPRQVLNHQFS